jgi:hypothetical protein
MDGIQVQEGSVDAVYNIADAITKWVWISNLYSCCEIANELIKTILFVH